MTHIWVVHWQWIDNSGHCRIIRAFAREDVALEFLADLKEHGDSGKTYTCTQVAFVPDSYS